MKRLLRSPRGCALILLALHAGGGLSFGQSTFERTYFVDEDAEGRSVQQTSDGGYIIAGSAESLPGGGNRDAVLIKLNFLGDTLWTRRYRGSYEDRGYSVRQTTDGGYIIAGSTCASLGGPTHLYLIKTNSAGDTLWTKTYEGYSEGRSIQQTSDAGYIIGGGAFDMYLVKTNSSGDTLWTRTYGGPYDDEGYSVQQTSDGGYVIAGSTEFNRAAHWETDVYLIKTNSSGDTLWSRTYGGTDWDRGHALQQTSDSGYIIAGCTTGDGITSPTHVDTYVVKTNSSGDTLWTRMYSAHPFVSLEDAYSVQQTSDGGYVIAGFTRFSKAPEQVYLVKTDSWGDQLWDRVYGYRYSTKGIAYSVQQASDGGYIITGMTHERVDPGRSPDLYVVKTRSDGLLDIPDPPTLSQPYDGAKGLSASPTLNWLWCPRAQSHRLQVALDSLFADLIVDDSAITRTSKPVIGLQHHTQYYWRVNASNQTGTSEYSAAWTFTTVVAAPLLVAPVNGATNQATMVTLIWNASRGATQYRLQIGVDSTFSQGLFLDDSTVVDTLRTVSGLALATRYFWRARAINAEGSSSWSQVWKFETKLALPALVTLISPADKAVVGKDSVRFFWRPGSPGVQRYAWELAEDSLFSSSVVDSLIADTSKVLRALPGGQTFWWRVAARNASGWGPFSLGNRFTTRLTDIAEPGEIPHEFSLSQNYPNPFNPTTKIRLSIADRQLTIVKVFDLLGREVTTLMNEVKSPGTYTVDFDGSGLAAGVYIYRMQAGNFVQAKKLVVLR